MEDDLLSSVVLLGHQDAAPIGLQDLSRGDVRGGRVSENFCGKKWSQWIILDYDHEKWDFLWIKK